MKGKRQLKTIITTYGEVVRKESESRVNNAISELRKSGKIVSVIPHNVGMKPIKLLYEIIYEEAEINPDKLEAARFLKTVTMTIDEVTEKESSVIPEQKVNEVIDNIYDKGGRVISIVPHNIGLNPVLVMYDIIYEAFEPIE